VEIADPTWWEREIRRRSKRRIDPLLYVAVAIIVLGIIASAYIVTFLGEGGRIGSITISKETVTYLLFVINAVNSGTGISGVFGILRYIQPRSTRYHRAALNIVDEAHRKGLLNDHKTQEIRDAIGNLLTRCDDPAYRKECEKELSEIAAKLAKIAAN